MAECFLLHNIMGLGCPFFQQDDLETFGNLRIFDDLLFTYRAKTVPFVLEFFASVAFLSFPFDWTLAPKDVLIWMLNKKTLCQMEDGMYILSVIKQPVAMLFFQGHQTTRCQPHFCSIVTMPAILVQSWCIHSGTRLEVSIWLKRFSTHIFAREITMKIRNCSKSSWKPSNLKI